MPPPRLITSMSGNLGRRGVIISTKRRRFSSNSAMRGPVPRWASSSVTGSFRGNRAGAQLAERLVPDAVLGRGAKGVARLDVAVPEAWVHAQAIGARVTGAVQLVNHPRRADVGEHAMLQHGGERVSRSTSAVSMTTGGFAPIGNPAETRARRTSLPLTASIQSPAVRTTSSTLRFEFTLMTDLRFFRCPA